MSEKFFEKKQLLAKRDTLFEEIGQTVFDAGELPSGFSNLPQEFHSMDILVDQLRDRARALKEERDLAHFDCADYLNEMARIDSEFNERIQPLTREIDELSLKVQVAKDKAGKIGKQDPDFDAKCGKLAKLEEKWRDIRKEKRVEINKVRAQMEPRELRLQRLDQGLRQIQDEEEQLISEKVKRLIDLGWHYYERGKDKAKFGSKYNQIEHLREALTEIGKVPRTLETEVPKRGERKPWVWVVTLLIAAALVIVMFRTRYRHADVSLANLTMNFQTEGRDNRLFVDLQRHGRAQGLELPILESLPGGEVFRGLSVNDLVSCMVVRGQDSGAANRVVGLYFKNEPANFGARLNQLGWQYLGTEQNWLALSLDDWVWVMLNPREYLLCRRDDMAALLKLEQTGNTEILYLNRRMESFGNNDGVLQDLNLFSLSLGPESFNLQLSSTKELPDWDRKKLRLEKLTESGLPEGVEMVVEEKSVHIRGPRSAFSTEDYSNSEIRNFIYGMVNRLRDTHVAALTGTEFSALPVPPLPGFPSLPPRSGNAKLRIYNLSVPHPYLVEEMDWGVELSDVAFTEDRRRLFLLDRGAGALYRMRLRGGRPTFERALIFEEEAPDWARALGFRFRGERISLTPDGNYCLVMEAESQNRPRLLVVRTSDMEQVWVEPLPVGVERAISAAWDEEGQFLYLGVEGKRVRRTDSALGILVYRREEGVLHLSQLLDQDLDGSDRVRVPGLLFSERQNAVFFIKMPENGFYRFDRALETYSRPAPLIAGQVQTDYAFVKSDRSGLKSWIVLDTLDPVGGRVLLAGLGQGVPTIEDEVQFSFGINHAVVVPTADQLWLISRQERALVRLILETDRLLPDRLITTPGFVPTRMAVDRWGDLAFVIGRQEEGSP